MTTNPTPTGQDGEMETLLAEITSRVGVDGSLADLREWDFRDVWLGRCVGFIRILQSRLSAAEAIVNRVFPTRNETLSEFVAKTDVERTRLEHRIKEMDRERQRMEIPRAAMMLRIAAQYINEYCPHEMIRYDEAECDGYCVADDCESVADSLSPSQPSDGK